MGSHFSAIGFPVRTYGEFEDLMARALEHGECIETRRGAYVRWSLGAGPELWAQEYENGEFGLVPHFAGEAIMRVGLTERIERPEAPPLDDAFYGWADPEDAEDMESGLFPLVFDVPDYVLHQNLSLPVIVEARISAFAHELTAYSGEEEFLADQEEPKFSPEFFIPSGTFKSGGETMDPPGGLRHLRGPRARLLAADQPRNGHEVLVGEGQALRWRDGRGRRPGRR